MPDTPQFRLDVAELKLEEYADKKADLLAEQTADRNQRMQALSTTHTAEYRALVDRQHAERVALNHQINRNHSGVKQALAEQISQATAEAKQARKELTAERNKQRQAAEAKAIADNIAAQYERNRLADEYERKLKAGNT